MTTEVCDGLPSDVEKGIITRTAPVPGTSRSLRLMDTTGSPNCIVGTFAWSKVRTARKRAFDWLDETLGYDMVTSTPERHMAGRH